jgi:hypothetical protein
MLIFSPKFGYILDGLGMDIAGTFYDYLMFVMAILCPFDVLFVCPFDVLFVCPFGLVCDHLVCRFLVCCKKKFIKKINFSLHDQDRQTVHLPFHLQERHLARARVQRLLHARRLQALVPNK